MSDPYLGYVASAYAVALGAVVGLVAYAVMDRRTARGALAKAERAAARTGTAT